MVQLFRPILVQSIWRPDSTAAVTAQFTGTRLPLITLPPIPFIPVDYPNPRGPPPLLQAFVSPPSGAQQITLKPFLQSDYPNPRGAAPIPQSMWQSIPPTLVPFFRPFNQTDWPVPRGPPPLLQENPKANIIVAVLPAITINRGPLIFRNWSTSSLVALHSQSWTERFANPTAPVAVSAAASAAGSSTAIATGVARPSPFFNEYAAYVYQFPSTSIRFASYDPVSRLLWVQFLSGMSVVVPNISVGTASSIQSATGGGYQFVLALARSVNPFAA